MSDKKLNISAALTIKTGEAEKVLQKLQKEGTKISQILKGLDVNTNQGRAGFAKSLATANKEMLKLRGTTQDTAKVMEHTYGRQIERQTKNLDTYTKKIEILNKKFKEQKYNAQFYQGINPELSQKFSSQADRTANKVVVAEVARQATQAALDDLKHRNAKPPVDWTSRFAAGSTAAHSFGNLSGQFQAMKNMEAGNLAGVRDIERRLLHEAMSGDFKSLYHMSKGPRGNNGLRKVVNQSGGRGAIYGDHVGHALGSGFDILGGLSAMRGGGSGGQGSGGAPGTATGPGGMNAINFAAGTSTVSVGAGNLARNVGQLTTGGVQNAEAASINQGLQLDGAQDILGNAAIDAMRAQMGARIHGARALQGGHMKAWGIGRGHGMDVASSIALAEQLSGIVGNQGALGTAGRSITDRKRFGMPTSSAQAARVRGQISAAEAAGFAYAPEEGVVRGGKAEDIVYTRNRTVGADSGIMGHVKNLEKRGIGTGVGGMALGNMMMASGNDSGKADKRLEDVMTKAFGRGITDSKLAEDLVSFVGQIAYGPNGPLGAAGSEVGMALSFGVNSKKDMQANIGGWQAANNLFQKNDFFKVNRLLQAKQAMGGNITSMQALALSNASDAELYEGAPGGLLETAGIGKAMGRGILEGGYNKMISTHRGMWDKDPKFAKFRAAFDATGGDIAAAAKSMVISKDGKKMLDPEFASQGALIGQTLGMSGEDSRGWLRNMVGLGSTADIGPDRKNFGKNSDGMAEGTAIAQQKVLSDLYKEEIEIRKQYHIALQAASAETAFMDKDATRDSATRFIEKLEKLIDQKLNAQRLGRGFGPSHAK